LLPRSRGGVRECRSLPVAVRSNRTTRMTANQAGPPRFIEAAP